MDWKWRKQLFKVKIEFSSIFIFHTQHIFWNQWMINKLKTEYFNLSFLLVFSSLTLPCFTYKFILKKVLVAQLCLTLCHPMDCSPHQVPLSMEFSKQEYWGGLPFSRGSSWPRDWTQVSCTTGRFFTVWFSSIFIVYTQHIVWNQWMINKLNTEYFNLSFLLGFSFVNTSSCTYKFILLVSEYLVSF